MSSTWQTTAPARLGNMAAESADTLRFLQRRIALLAAATSVIAGTFLVVSSAAALRVEAIVDGRYGELGRGAHLIGTCILIGVWLCTRGKRQLSARALTVLDAVLVIAACLSWSLMGLGLGGDAGVFTGVLASLLTCLARAVLVPTTVFRTFWTTALALAPLPIVAALVVNAPTSNGFGPNMLIVQAGMWSLSGLGLSLIVTRIVYGLHKQVHEAQQLGQYTLEHRIGRGGMGEVYRARHALLCRPTAIKLLSETGAEQLRRFEREVQLTSQLTHPNTIVVYDYGHTPDGVFYYAMEYLDGLDLAALVRQAGPLPPERVIHLLLQVCAALSEAHGVGLIHRDIKPENIVVGVRGGVHDFVKVLDFGLVKELDSAGTDRALTVDATIAGTPHYMSPEAILGEDVDARADLYAIGCLGHYLLTGKPVFDGKAMMAVCSAHLEKQPTPVAELRPDMPADLDAVLLACLAKDREQRPASAELLVGLLLGCEAANRWTREQAKRCWEDASANPAASARLDHLDMIAATVQVATSDRATR